MTTRYTTDEAVRAPRKITLASTVPAAADFNSFAQVHGEWGFGLATDGVVYLMALLATAANTLSQNYSAAFTQV